MRSYMPKRNAINGELPLNATAAQDALFQRYTSDMGDAINKDDVMGVLEQLSNITKYVFAGTVPNSPVLVLSDNAKSSVVDVVSKALNQAPQFSGLVSIPQDMLVPA